MNYKIPDPETFFLKTPLYEKFGPLGSNYRDVLKIEFNQDTIDTFCIECNQNSIFTCTAQLPQVGMGVQSLSPKSVEDLIQNYQTAWLPTVEGDSVAQTKLEEYTLRDAYFDGHFDELAAYVGDAESIIGFERQTRKLIDATVVNRNVFKARVDQMWKEKREWQVATAQLAQEILGR